MSLLARAKSLKISFSGLADLARQAGVCIIDDDCGK
jgi:hypothetical protein